MPLYEYRCRTCEAVYEERRPMADADAPATCPEGHVGAARLLPVFATTGQAPPSRRQGCAGRRWPAGAAAGCACHPG